ncbi:MAG: hypothetical protein AAGC85_25330, partial [Bacteroidota bacterium]
NYFKHEDWFPMVIKKTKSGLNIYSKLPSNAKLTGAEEKYASIHEFRKYGWDSWIQSVSDEEFFQILESDDLFVSENWQRISTD